MAKVTKPPSPPSSPSPANSEANENTVKSPKSSPTTPSTGSDESTLEPGSSKPKEITTQNHQLVSPTTGGALSPTQSEDDDDFDEWLLEDDTFLDENELFSLVPTAGPKAATDSSSTTPATNSKAAAPPTARKAWDGETAAPSKVDTISDSSPEDDLVNDDTFAYDHELFSIPPASESHASPAPPHTEEPNLNTGLPQHPVPEERPQEVGAPDAPAIDAQPTETAQVDNLQQQWFQVGKMLMSGADIQLTIEIVEEMETTLMACMKRLLNETSTPTGVRSQKQRPRVIRKVPAPDGGERQIRARQKKDSIRSVKERYLSPQEHRFLRNLADELPEVVEPESGRLKSTGFKLEVLRVLYQPKVELYQMRTLLPIKESGNLLQSAQEGETTTTIRYERVASTMLKQKAKALLPKKKTR